jgi:hypothetical protein
MQSISEIMFILVKIVSYEITLHSKKGIYRYLFIICVFIFTVIFYYLDQRAYYFDLKSIGT